MINYGSETMNRLLLRLFTGLQQQVSNPGLEIFHHSVSLVSFLASPVYSTHAQTQRMLAILILEIVNLVIKD